MEKRGVRIFTAVEAVKIRSLDRSFFSGGILLEANPIGILT